MARRRSSTFWYHSARTFSASPDVVGALARAAAGIPALQLLLLFGSRARDDSHVRSDWDLGYLAADPFDPAALLARAIEIEAPK